MDYLRRRHAPICRQWFEELQPLGLDSGLLKVYIDNSVQRNYLQRKCLEQFNEAAQATTGALVAVRFVGDKEEPIDTATTPQPALVNHEHTASVAVTDPPQANPNTTYENASQLEYPIGSQFDQIVLSPDYSFDNFVTGPANNLAYAASVAVANQPGITYNPLFIHGGVGLGKTHLLQAICQTIIQNNASMRICYLSCDTFMNQFIDCVQRGKMSQFRHHYRQVDLLVIDDIHILANRERTQEEFFHTFNALYQSSRQIVLSSDSPPAQIPQLEERLVSRFQWGLVAQITKPDYETRVAIVRAKAQLREIEIPDQVIEYIANRIESNARELEGAITTIQGHAALQHRPIDLTLAYEALGEPVSKESPTQVTLQDIIEAVTAFYNVKLSDLQSKRRHKSIAGPRQVCMWLARKRTRFSLEEIGGYFGGRDHTTVMHSVKTVEDRIATDPETAQQIQQIDDQIGQSKTTHSAQGMSTSL